MDQRLGQSAPIREVGLRLLTRTIRTHGPMPQGRALRGGSYMLLCCTAPPTISGSAAPERRPSDLCQLVEALEKLAELSSTPTWAVLGGGPFVCAATRVLDAADAARAMSVPVVTATRQSAPCAMNVMASGQPGAMAIVTVCSIRVWKSPAADPEVAARELLSKAARGRPHRLSGSNNRTSRTQSRCRCGMVMPRPGLFPNGDPQPDFVAHLEPAVGSSSSPH
jgi:hypothetical protein